MPQALTILLAPAFFFDNLILYLAFISVHLSATGKEPQPVQALGYLDVMVYMHVNLFKYL